MAAGRLGFGALEDEQATAMTFVAGYFHTHSGRLALWAVVLAAVVLRLWVAWQPGAQLIEKTLPDDAYYYFMLAHHTVQSGVVSIDGLNTTNGFHPLWYVVLLPIFGPADALTDTHIHMALSLASLFDGVAVWSLSQIGARLTRQERYGVLAGVLYAANPTVVLQTVNGLETALGMACLTLFWLQAVRCLEREGTARQLGGLGLLGGLMFLARSDSVFFLALTVLSLGLFWGWPMGLKRSALIGLVAALVALPWFLWSYSVTGQWLQESGVAVPYAIRVRFELMHGADLWTWAAEALRQLGAGYFWLRGDPVAMPLMGGGVVWLVTIGLLLGLQVRRSQPPWPLHVIAPLLLAGGLLIVVHAGLRWYPRPWYFLPMAAVFAVSGALVAASYRIRRSLALGLLAGWLAYCGITGYGFWQVGLYPWQKEMLLGSLWLRQHVPAGERAASFNAGIYAFYSGRVVLNLDGVVNSAAYQAVRERAIADYLDQSFTTWVIDYDHALRREYAHFLGADFSRAFEEVAVIGGQADAPLGSLRVYRATVTP
ncbi:MAG: hypothetical protein ACT4QE_25145 [Anaerolineales bacterium]